VTADLFNIINVPTMIWIDERGVIVRPAEPAWAAGRWRTEMTAGIEEAPERLQRIIARALAEEIDPEGYVAALRDWVAKGDASAWALSPEEVVRRSTPRSSTGSGGRSAPRSRRDTDPTGSSPFPNCPGHSPARFWRSPSSACSRAPRSTGWPARPAR